MIIYYYSYYYTMNVMNLWCQLNYKVNSGHNMNAGKLGFAFAFEYLFSMIIIITRLHICKFHRQATGKSA